MNSLPENLKKALDEYESMQTKHLDALENDREPDLKKFNFERSKAFENLKIELHPVLLMTKGSNVTDVSLETFDQCKARIATIIERESRISVRIRKYRDEIQCLMKKMSHGKRAIAGYGKQANAYHSHA